MFEDEDFTQITMLERDKAFIALAVHISPIFYDSSILHVVLYVETLKF